MNTVVVELLTVGIMASVFIFLAKVLSNKYQIPVISKFYNTI
jgi:protein involved in ribonucleotide reduction